MAQARSIALEERPASFNLIPVKASYVLLANKLRLFYGLDLMAKGCILIQSMGLD